MMYLTISDPGTRKQQVAIYDNREDAEDLVKIFKRMYPEVTILIEEITNGNNLDTIIKRVTKKYKPKKNTK